MKLERKHASRLIRNGRRVYGGVFELMSGRKVYLAFRKNGEMFRGGEKTISDAITKNKASWAIDNDTLIRMRIEGIYLIGVLTKETGDIYLATLADFLKAPLLNYEKRGGALQRYLPLDRFLIQLGTVRKQKAPKRRSYASAL